jgi:acyl-CoA thioesterase YciA
MPRETNPAGDIFGGWLMSQMDLAGAMTAGERARGRTATVAVDGMAFHRPVYVGDVLCCYTDIVRIGMTSITLMIEAWVLRGRDPGKRELVTRGQFTFVAIDPHGNKRPVPAE